MLNDIRISAANTLKKLLVTKFGKKCIIQTPVFGSKKFFSDNSIELFRTLNYGGEHTSLGAFLFLLKNDDIVFDIGASVGLFSIYAAEKVEHLVSFEPDPSIYYRLNENVRLNQLTNKITTEQLAISDSNGSMLLNSDGLFGMSPSLSDLDRHSNKIEVDVISLDTYTKKHNLYPTVLKIDIEGAEILALKGSRDLLKSKHKPRLLFIEVHPDFLPAFSAEERDITNILHENDYKILNTQRRDNQFHVIAISNN